MNHDRLTEHWNFGGLQFSDGGESSALQPTHQSTVENGGIDFTGFQRLTDEHGITDGQKRDVVALGFEADELQCQNCVDPCCATGILNAKALSTQFFSAPDGRMSDQ